MRIKIVYPSDDLADDVHNNIGYHNVQQQRNIHNNLYTLANNELQLSSDLDGPNGADDWKNTNSHKGELVIGYDTKARNNTLHPKVFYALYIKPKGDSDGHLIYKLSTDQILVTIKYQSVPVSEDLIETMNRTDSSENKIQIDHFNIK